MSKIFDAKVTQKKLIQESDLDRKIKEEIKTLATKAKLKAEQDKIVKLQTHDLSLFIGQSYFVNNGSQNYLIFKSSCKTITTFSGLPFTVSEWESKGLSNGKFKPPYTANKGYSPKLL